MSNIEDDVKILENAIKCNKKQFEELDTHILLQDDEQEALENILSDYTRQKQINEEHKKLNGELREKVKELEAKNKHLSNTSDYETISLECTHLGEQLEIANNKMQELEEENYIQKIQIYENSIPKQTIIDKIEKLKNDYDQKYDLYMGYKIESREQQDILRQMRILQELLEGGK